MADPHSVRFGPVTLGYPRISVIAVLGASASGWTSADWEALRESGVSVACAEGVLNSGPVPVLPLSSIALASDAGMEGKIFLDKDFQVSEYPRWARTLERPWGPLVSGGHALPLALAAVVAGAPLVGWVCENPTDAAELVTELKGLAGVLGRELTRVPKKAEGAVSSETPSQERNKRYGRRAGAQVGFQGEHGAFSEMAVYNLFPSDTCRAVPFPSFRDVFSAVLAGEVSFGMIPIENALAGPINENYDLLLEFPDLHIVGETQVRVEHNLIGFPGTPLDKIRRVFSHPQGLAQSKVFLEGHSEWEAVPFYDTAGSVKHVAEQRDPTWAAIASAEAARVYGLEILVPGVETNHRNYTRFFLIAPRTEDGTGTANKVSLVFGTADEPGALSRCLAVFASHGVNMTKLESRPIHGRPWAYMFYIDARLPAEPGAFDRTVAELATVTQDLRVLGLYQA